MANIQDIRTQLLANFQTLKGDSHWEQVARGAIDSALNAVDANQWIFAADRLGVAIAALITEVNRIRN